MKTYELVSYDVELPYRAVREYVVNHGGGTVREIAEAINSGQALLESSQVINGGEYDDATLCALMRELTESCYPTYYQYRTAVPLVSAAYGEVVLVDVGEGGVAFCTVVASTEPRILLNDDGDLYID